MDQHRHEYCHRHTDNDSSVLFGSAAVQEETRDKRTHLTWTICKHIRHKHAYYDHLSTSSSLDGLRTQSLCYLDDPTRVVITKLILLLVHYYCHYYNYFFINAFIFILFILSCIECLSLTEDLYSLSSLTFGYHVTRVSTPPPPPQYHPFYVINWSRGILDLYRESSPPPKQSRHMVITLEYITSRVIIWRLISPNRTVFKTSFKVSHPPCMYKDP